MDEVVVVGAVPDEVLLACGRPDGVPSAWWTPALHREGAADAVTLRAATSALLDEIGVVDRGTGQLRGRLGLVSEVVADAELVLLIELERPDGSVQRRSVIAAGERALLDLVDVDGGIHDLLLASARAATALVVALLGDGGPGVVPLAGRCSAGAVDDAYPAAERTSTVRMLRSTVGGEDVAHAVTVVDHPRGVLACWALPGGDVEVQPLVGEDGVVSLVLGLLGASAAVPA